MKSIVIYGGTFNPMHTGHRDTCRYLLGTEEFHHIIVIPSSSPPHKAATALVSGQHRLAICRLAVEGMSGVEIDGWEVAKGGKSYTVDTLEYLSEKYTGHKLYLLMGSDMFLSFTRWKDWQRIGELVTLLVASREAEDREKLEEQSLILSQEGVTSRLLDNPVVEISSTQVRQELAQRGYSGYLTPAVNRYIKVHGLYRENGEKPYDLQQLRAVVKPLQNEKRYRHSLAVEKAAAALAIQYGCDPNKAAAAAILHDICKNMDNDRLLQIVKSCDTITNIDFGVHPQLLHSRAGGEYITKELGITDEDIINAVRYHTSARGNMSLLEEIIYIADLTSEDRTYPDVEKLRGIAKRSLEEAMAYALRYIAGELSRRGQPVCEDTARALEQYN